MKKLDQFMVELTRGPDRIVFWILVAAVAIAVAHGWPR